MITNSSWAVDLGFDGASFVVSGMRIWPLTAFLGLWLCGWTAGELAALRSLMAASTPAFGSVFLMVWLIGWTLGGLFAWAVFLYSIAGREVVIVGPGRLRLRWEVFSLRWTREYAAETIRDLRVKEAQPPRPGRVALGAMSALTFSHPGGNVVFGIGLTPEKAAGLLQAIRGRGALPDSAFAKS
ncbi:MAG: hypothetical protein A2V88_03055 [Elusimicrobia bacterium RBG_16_66_12]|nr:MAG: hypothetical protein A2V88_03055 [Elusimicrobia bacterium RBG_16_66_12]